MAEAIPINQPFAGSLAAPLGAAGTSLTLSSGHGARFSDPSGDTVRLLIVRASDGAIEYLTFDTRDDDVLLNLARGAESPGDSALEFAIGDTVIELLTKGGLTALLAASGGGSGTSISHAGGSVTINDDGSITINAAAGQAVEVYANDGNNTDGGGILKIQGAGAGGHVNMSARDGNSPDSGPGGAGGDMFLDGANGGSGTDGDGGTGGRLFFDGGNGGSATNGIGGIGGAAEVSSGRGGDGELGGGAGGTFALAASNGGAATAGDNNGGAGGDLTIRAGAGGSASGGGQAGANGNILLPALPTSDPAIAGALWNNAGMLSISAG